MKKPIIYLSGNMTPSAEYYNSWTKRVTKDLEDLYSCTSSVFKKGNKHIVHQDLNRLRTADIVIVNLGLTDTYHHMTGAIVECYEAVKQGKTVYAFHENNSEFDTKRSHQADSPWFSEFISKEFDSYNELINYMIYDENLLV